MSDLSVQSGHLIRPRTIWRCMSVRPTKELHYQAERPVQVFTKLYLGDTRPRRGASAARTPHARSRLGHRKRPAAGLQPAPRCPPVLLNLGEPGAFAIPPWADRVQ